MISNALACILRFILRKSLFDVTDIDSTAFNSFHDIYISLPIVNRKKLCCFSKKFFVNPKINDLINKHSAGIDKHMMEAVFRIDSLETFTTVCEEILDNLYSSKPLAADTTLEHSVVQTAKEDIRKIISSNNFDISKVSGLIEAKGWEHERVKTFNTLMEKKKTELLYAILLHNNSQYGETVTDFDWFLKLVCGSSSLKSLRYPVLQLVLSTATANGDQRRRVFDINRETLGELISVLESSIDE